MDQTPSLPPNVVNIIKDYQINQYCIIAALSVIIWECIICFPTEVRVIWTQKFTTITAAYGLCRYFGLGVLLVCVSTAFGRIPEHKCTYIAHFLPTFNGVNLLAAQTILGARTLALWERSNIIFAIVVVSMITEAGFLIAGAVKWDVIPGLSKIVPGCVGMIDPISGKNFLGLAYFVIQILVDGLFLGLSTWKVLAWRTKHGGETPLLKIIVRDGLLYYVVIWSLSITGVLLLLSLPTTKSFVVMSFLTFTMASVSVLSCRFVLHIRSESQVSLPPSYGSNSKNTRSVSINNIASTLRRGATTFGNSVEYEMNPPTSQTIAPIRVMIQKDVVSTERSDLESSHLGEEKLSEQV